MSAAVLSRPEAEAPTAAAEDHDWVARLLAGDPVIRRIYDIVSTADPAKFDIWLRFGREVADGVDFEEAKARFERDIAAIDAAPSARARGRTPPPRRRVDRFVPPRRLRYVPGITCAALMDSGSVIIPEIGTASGEAVTGPPRTIRLVDTGFAPDLRPGDLVVVVPVSRYRCEGLYLLSFGDGHQALYRCEARQGRIHLWKDSPNWRGERLALSPKEFRDAVLAQVALTCRLVSAGLLPEVREIV